MSPQIEFAGTRVTSWGKTEFAETIGKKKIAGTRETNGRDEEKIMRNKHRIYEENRPYFITVVLDNRRRLFGDERWVRLMADIVAYYKGAMEFKLYEYVFMPDHYHVIISATPNRTFSDVIKRINGCFSRRHNSLTGNRGWVFRKEFYDIGIRDDSDYIRMAEYIHNNPVRSGFVDRPEDYSWSSAGHRLCGRCSLMGVDDWR